MLDRPDARVSFRLNGEDVSVAAGLHERLSTVLREHLGLRGTKSGCDAGDCGACTVLIDGAPSCSCLVALGQARGAEIITIEGLGQPGALHPLQAAFIEHDAFQCGYCTPGQICSAQGLINEGRAHTRADVRELMSGNLCRCGAYTNIADAVCEVMAERGAGALREAAE